MYAISSAVLCAILFAAMLVSVELGQAVGRGRQPSSDEGKKLQTGAIQGAILGLFALLLGFTFSMAANRYDSRNRSVTDEANAIGTAYLRSQLLPEAAQPEVAETFRDYVEVRVQASDVDLTRGSSLDDLNHEASELQSRLWAAGIEAARADPNPVTSGLYLQAVNELIDSHASRTAALRNHIPELVVGLLVVVFVGGAGVVGYASGLSGGRRPLFAMVAMNLLIVLMVFIIIDLDRPRRGVIKTDLTSLIQLRESMNGPTGAG